VVVHKGGFARVVPFRVAVDDETIASYSADGVVISTPTGSTAYSLSAGGPVVVPTLETLMVTPVSAHTLAIRPVVCSADSRISVRAEDAVEELMITVDGQVGGTFGLGEMLSVSRAPQSIKIVRFPGDTFFATLRQKLGWGGIPERDQSRSQG
jgi:NAD+ kinase